MAFFPGADWLNLDVIGLKPKFGFEGVREQTNIHTGSLTDILLF